MASGLQAGCGAQQASWTVILETLRPSAHISLNEQQTAAASSMAESLAGFGLSWDCKLTAIEVEAKMKLKPGLSWLPYSWLK